MALDPKIALVDSLEALTPALGKVISLLNNVEDDLERLLSRITATLTDAGILHAGVIFRDILLNSNNTELQHDLGRVPTVVLALKVNFDVNVYVDTVHADPRRFVYVKAGSVTIPPATVTLLVA